MTSEGPLLEAMTRRLADCPADFLADPSTLEVAAVVNDTIRDLGGNQLSTQSALIFQIDSKKSAQAERNRLQIIMISCWLAHDSWFTSRPQFANQCIQFLCDRVPELAGLVNASKFVSEPDRREELVRAFLQALALRPLGETNEQALDRLATLSSVERQRVILESRVAEERARKIREAMAAKAAAEAATAYARD